MLAVLLLFGILFLYLFTSIFSLHRRSLDWNGEGSILKTPQTYRAKFFSLTDILMLSLVFMAIAIFLISFSVKNDSIAQLLVIFIAIASLLVPFLHFRIKYQYWQQNRQKDYVFDPISKEITIVGEYSTSFSFDDIQVLEHHISTNKFTQGYIKLIFKDGRPPVFLTPLLPCYALLPDFFVSVEKHLINQRIFGIG
ncbi:hypothetical protein [Emticicia sp. W12TSBA100-4]|uniref:hypothetical protein n=1 Tax=Emticicia sp. W12TSBA100-4 TaxID=3160965 RepID=UPI003306322B